MALHEGSRRGFPFAALGPAEIGRLIGPYSDGATVLSASALEGGLRNSNYVIRLSNSIEQVVLRVFTAEEPRACCIREAALARLIEPRVPVARVLHSEPDSDPPWSILAFVDAARFDEVLRDSSAEQIEHLSRSAGRVLGAIHSYQFPSAGWLSGPELATRIRTVRPQAASECSAQYRLSPGSAGSGP